MSQPKTIFLVAGGTGGHVFPALALTEELLARGYQVECLTDKRGEKFFRNTTIVPHVIQSSAWGGDWKAKLKAAIKILQGMIHSFELCREYTPSCVVGFGGYPSFPTLKAAQLLKVPTFLHEQNAVFGRANRQLAPQALRIAVSFKDTKLLPAEYKNKVVITGNPIRANFTAAVTPYAPPSADGAINLLIFGGSQGSALFGKVLPEAVSLLPEDIRRRLFVTQQTRFEEVDTVKKTYQEMGVAAQIQPFFTDILKLYQQAHLVVARAGASTVTELTALGRPAIFIPLAASLDGDQAQNAAQVVENNGGWLLPEKTFTAQALAAKLTELFSEPLRLEQAARAAAALGRPDAAARLANAVTKLI